MGAIEEVAPTAVVTVDVNAPEGMEWGVLLEWGGAVPSGELVKELRVLGSSKWLLQLGEMPGIDASALGALLTESTA